MITMRAPAELTSAGVSAFTVACVATGMKHGVGTTACGVVSVPARAVPWVRTSSNRTAMTPRDPHGVAVRQEAVALLHGGAVALHRQVVSSKRGHQRQERTLRHVKIGEQCVDDAKLVARCDEQPRRP